MGGKRNLVKRLFWLKQASLCLHNIPKDAKIQNFGDGFSTFLDFFLISLKIMILDFWKYNGYNGVPLYFHNSEIMIFNDFFFKSKNVENLPQKCCIFASFGISWIHMEACFSQTSLLTKFLISPIIKSFVFSYKL